MKIGIVTTYHPFTNLGSFLQAYALKLYLEDIGHEVYHIRIGNHTKQALDLVFHLRPYRSYLKRWVKAFKSLRDLRLLKYITYPSDGIDCCIWGSDEIWNVRNKYFLTPVFWGTEFHDVYKIAYAISMGHASSDDIKSEKQLTQGITLFDSILPRDKHTQTVLKELYNLDLKRVIDPTLLVDVRRLSDDIKIPSYKYLLVYTYGIPNHIIDIVRRFAKERHLKIISPCFWHIWADHTIECSALQLSTLMANADYVFTTTFHGAVFSLLNHTQCAILPLREKVKDLCTTLLSNKRLISETCDYDDFVKTISSPFDIDCFEKNLARLRNESMYLINVELSKICNETNIKKNSI